MSESTIDTTFTLLAVYAANVVITTPILIAGLLNTRKIFAKKLNIVVAFLLLCHFSFSVVQTIFRLSQLAVLAWPETNLALRLHAFFTSLYLVGVQGGNILLALERVKIITDSKHRFKAEMRVVLGMMAAECIAFSVVFSLVSSKDGITPEASSHYILWVSLLVASYLSTVTCVIRLYLKAYKFATKVLRETTEAIKSHRQASLIFIQTQLSAHSAIRQGPSESYECQDIDSLLEAGIADVTGSPMQNDATQETQASMARTPAPASRRMSLAPRLQSDPCETASIQQHVPQAATSHSRSHSSNQVYPVAVLNSCRPSCNPPYPALAPQSPRPSCDPRSTNETASKPSFTLRSFLKPSSSHAVESLDHFEQKGERIRFERRLLVGCILMSSSLVGCYLPYMIYFLVFCGMPGAGRTWDFVLLVSACDTVVTPLLIVYFQRDIRGALKDMVGLQFREDKENVAL